MGVVELLFEPFGKGPSDQDEDFQSVSRVKEVEGWAFSNFLMKFLFSVCRLLADGLVLSASDMFLINLVNKINAQGGLPGAGDSTP